MVRDFLKSFLKQIIVGGGGGGGGILKKVCLPEIAITLVSTCPDLAISDLNTFAFS